MWRSRGCGALGFRHRALRAAPLQRRGDGDSKSWTGVAGNARLTIHTASTFTPPGAASTAPPKAERWRFEVVEGRSWQRQLTIHTASTFTPPGAASSAPPKAERWRFEVVEGRCWQRPTDHSHGTLADLFRRSKHLLDIGEHSVRKSECSSEFIFAFERISDGAEFAILFAGNPSLC